jgi:aspartate aminotransferase-like enzyme
VRPFGQSFIPGPVDVHPDVLEATLQPYYFTFNEKMQGLLADMQPALRSLFGTTQTVFLSASAASGLMEAAVRSGVRNRVLAVAGGYFGEMFARIAEACGKEVIRAVVPPGHTLEPDLLARFLEGPEVDAVTLVHSESSTGALAPLPELARVVRARSDTVLLVDGVTSIGAMPMEMDNWGIDFLLTGSQKALALPPGMAIGAASPRLVARAESLHDRGFFLSATHLLNAARRNFPLTTPALPIVHALHCQLQRIEASGGLPARFARHQTLQRMLTEWAESRSDLAILADRSRRSPSVTALELRNGRPASEVVKALEARNWLVATGLAPLVDQVIRIGHMGDLEPHHLSGLLQQLEAVL